MSVYFECRYSAVGYFVFRLHDAQPLLAREISKVSAKGAMTHGDVRYSRLCLFHVELSDLFCEYFCSFSNLRVNFWKLNVMSVATLVFNYDVLLTKVLLHKCLTWNSFDK